MHELNGRKVRFTMAQALVQYLQAQFSERDGEQTRLIPAMYGIFGHGNASGLGQALGEYGQDLPFYQPCNEQAMVHTAIGYARKMRRRSTLACTASIGPGSTNMLTGAATATINRLPVLLLPSDYFVTRFQGPVLQQLEHPVSADVSVNDCFRPVSRFFDRISRPEQLLTALPEAMRVLTDPAETGAVTLSLPQDLQSHAYEYPAHFFDRRVWRIERRAPDPQRVHEAIELIAASKRPFLIAGGGAHYADAYEQLQRFSELCGIPVGETHAGKGAMPRDSDLLLGGYGLTGNPAAAKIASQADLVICVGTRLTDFSTASNSAFNNPDVRFISINVCGHDAYKLSALPITADARVALEALIEAAERARIQPNAEYVEEVRQVRQDWQRRVSEEVYQPHPEERMSQGELVGVLNQSAQPEDTVVAAAGSPPGDLHSLWDATDRRHCYLEFGYSCMGFEIPAALGIRMAQPKGEVFVLIGDGTYLMNPTEIVTAAREGMKITIVLSNNEGHQCIKNLQMFSVGRALGTELRVRNPQSNTLDGDYFHVDFAQNAASMGARVWTVSTPDQACNALKEAREEKGPCVIVAATERTRFVPAPGLWWDVEVAESTNDAVTQKLRGEYEDGRERLQRLHY
jgi:3D-(3,5/4)-trihydroxycyclohexane-1,2-dione acylhydrolase (decyclizing)